MASYEAAKYCEKNGIRFVIDIQDLWPEAFQMVFNIPVVSQVIFAPFTFLANGIYKRADGICGVSDTYCERALKVNKKCKKGTTVFLGTELDTFDRYAAGTPIIPDKEGEVRLAYCGTLGASYDLTCVIDAIEKHDFKITMLHEGAYPTNVCLQRFYGHYVWGRPPACRSSARRRARSTESS